MIGLAKMQNLSPIGLASMCKMCKPLYADHYIQDTSNDLCEVKYLQ